MSLLASRCNSVWQRSRLTHLAQESVATNHRTHLASWAPIFCAWYPDAKAACLAQGICLLMYEFLCSYRGAFKSRSQLTESLPEFQISDNLLAKAIKRGFGNKISPIPAVFYNLGHCDLAAIILCRQLHPANNSPSSLPTKVPS